MDNHEKAWLAHASRSINQFCVGGLDAELLLNSLAQMWAEPTSERPEAPDFNRRLQGILGRLTPAQLLELVRVWNDKFVGFFVDPANDLAFADFVRGA